MGGKSTSETNSTAQLTPYAPATGAVNGLLSNLTGLIPGANLTGDETKALDTLKANGQAGSPYAPAIGDAATGLLSGGGAKANDGAISDNLAGYKGLLDSTANGSRIGDNSGLKPQLDTLLNDTMNAYGGQFAASGRDITGNAAGGQAIARGFAAGAAPIVAAQYNTDVDRALAAAGNIYNAGNTTTGLLNQNNQQANTNKTTGVDVGNAALTANNWGANTVLNAEGAARSIPRDALTTLLGSIAPIAQAFGTQNSQSNTENQMSGVQQLATLMQGIGSMMPKAPITFA